MKKILFTLAAVAACLAACNNETDGPITPYVKKITISPTITRATEMDFEEGDKIGLTIIKSDESFHAENALLTFTEGVFTGNTNWYTESNDLAHLVAYHPYDESGAPTSFTVALDQSGDGYGKSDLLGASEPNVVPSKSAVGMKFRHLLTKLIVNVTNESGADITSVAFQGAIPTADIDLKGLAVEVDDAAEVAEITAQQVTKNALYRAIVVPQEVAMTLVVKTSAGKTLLQPLATATLRQGAQYKIDVIVEADVLKVTLGGEIDNWTDEGEIGPGEEKPDYELRILTFEDEDYKGNEGPGYWAGRIDAEEYGGELLYGDYTQTGYCWYDDGNTLLGHEMPFMQGMQVYWGGGHAISNYVETDLANGDYTRQLSVYHRDPVTGFGGHNGSKNFCMQFGYAETGGLGNQYEELLPYIYFTDYTARVVDHMYVAASTYALNVWLGGNSLSDPLGANDWVMLEAIGYDENFEPKPTRAYFYQASDKGIFSDWQKWDLSVLGEVTMIYFNIEGSSNNGYGFSQPAYFAYDDVAVRWKE